MLDLCDVLARYVEELQPGQWEAVELLARDDSCATPEWPLVNIAR